MSRAMTRLGGDPSQVNLSKQVIRELLVSGKAVVQSIQGKKATDPQLLRGALYQRRCTSDVWSKFGSVRVLSADPGVPDTVCKDVVACGECYQVYVHRNMSQGTSSLRLHRCQKAAASVVVDVDYGALHLEFLQEYSEYTSGNCLLDSSSLK